MDKELTIKVHKKRGHKLLPEKIKGQLPKLYSQESADNQMAVLKFFTPYGSWTWYVIEGEEMKNGDFEFFGLVDGFEKELGYFYLSELEEATVKMGDFDLPAVERDIYFEKTEISKLK